VRYVQTAMKMIVGRSARRKLARSPANGGT
jgi:hypothetical protein